MDGMDISAIAHHLRISRKQVHILRDNIVNQIRGGTITWKVQRGIREV
jgi:hypothetical protein